MSSAETSDQERVPRVGRKLAQLLVMQLQDELGRWEERFAGTQVGAAQEAAGQPMHGHHWRPGRAGFPNTQALATMREVLRDASTPHAQQELLRLALRRRGTK